MGTRGFTGWKLNGRLVIVYQQFDSYPSGIGERVAVDLRMIQLEIATALLESRPELARDMRGLTEATRAELRSRFGKIRRLTDRTRITPALIEKLASVTDPRVSSGSDIYARTRELQGNLRGMLDLGVAYHYGDEWPRESVFCEWGYLLNFDADEGLGRFEVYRGFQKQSPTAGEWAGEPAPLEDQYEWVPNPKWGKPGEPYNKRRTVGKAPSEYFPANCVRWFSLVPPPAPEQVVAVEEQVDRAENPEGFAEQVADELAAEGILVKQIGD